MKILKLSSLALAVFMSAATLNAQTADEIVAKHIDAIGGKEKLKGVKSIRMEGNINVMGNEAPMVVTVLDGKGYKSEVDFQGQSIINAMNDKGGWMVNPMMGSSEPQALPDEQYKLSKEQIYTGGAFLDYAAKGTKVELAGKEGNAFKLNVTSADGAKTTYFLDPTTYYITKIVKVADMGGQSGELSINFSDYKKTDFGNVIPYTMETTLPQGFSFTSSIKKVEVNKDVDPKIFEMPKK